MFLKYKERGSFDVTCPLRMPADHDSATVSVLSILEMISKLKSLNGPIQREVVYIKVKR